MLVIGRGVAIRVTGSILTGSGSKPGMLTIRSLANDCADITPGWQKIASSIILFIIINPSVVLGTA
jgi:hypothetical protein